MLLIFILLIHTLGPASSKEPYSNSSEIPSQPQLCLTGYMTDVQHWVDKNGALSSAVDPHNTLDLTAVEDVVPTLYREIQSFRPPLSNRTVTYLSMARCKLNRIPMIFSFQDTQGRPIAFTVEYMTLYGNRFMEISTSGQDYDVTLNASKAKETPVDFGFKRPIISAWSASLTQVQFSRLKELDLRRCNIQILSDNIFRGMPHLEALYLGENAISYVSSNAFYGLRNLLHLDLSFNIPSEDIVQFESSTVFSRVKKLQSLDLSLTRLDRRSIAIFTSLTKSFQRLSVCGTGLPRLTDNLFINTSLKYLDVSRNSGILTESASLKGTERTLEVLYAESVGLRSFDIFENFEKLEILNLKHNDLVFFPMKLATSLKSLQVLDLKNNRLTTWFGNIFSYMPSLRFLSLKNNNINVINGYMLTDLHKISFIALSGNSVVCNCHAREYYEIALGNEKEKSIKALHTARRPLERFSYHTGFDDFNAKIQHRTKMSRNCKDDYCKDDVELEADGNFIVIDYEEDIYECLLASEGRSVHFTDIPTCPQSKRDIYIDDPIADSWNKLLALIVIPVVIFPLLIFSYICRRNFRYCFITMRNSTLLSLISREDRIDESTIFHYDVFVSYCNEDRNWVLDYLLPHVEKDCNVSVCLHERDFQVGLSILENIVSCMDRSRSIMLVISKKFLMSQWCQFEMHLAQHRLLETRREDLILVLLEQVPRRLRPTTLHYLMLTKTYIVWPKRAADEPAFWRRLRRTIDTYRARAADNVSLV